MAPGFKNIDQNLLQLIAGGCERSFRKLYDLYAGKVYTMAMGYLKSPLEAQDVVQEIFVKVWEKRDGLPAIDNFPAYLYIIARNQLINQLQKKVPVYNQDELILQAIPEDRHLPQQQLDYRELTTLISHAIEQLPSRQQQVYRLSREQGLSHQQIAKQLNLSYDTVREHMSKALKNIRASLEKEYGQIGVLLWLFWQA